MTRSRKEQRRQTLGHRHSVLNAVKRILATGILLVASVVMVFPLAWMVSTSLKTRYEVFEFPIRWIPRTMQFGNYLEIFEVAPFERYTLNSLVVTVGVVVTNIVFCSMAGFGFAKYRGRAMSLLFLVVLFCLMIPFQTIVIPVYLAMRTMRLLNTYAGIGAPIAITAFGVFLMRQFMLVIPDDLISAARIDGCTEWRIFAQVVLPLVKPGLATLGIFASMWAWNDFFWPLVAVTRPEMRTLPIAISIFEQVQETQFQLQMAVSVVMVLPVLLVFVRLQRHFVENAALSGLKF